MQKTRFFELNCYHR